MHLPHVPVRCRGLFLAAATLVATHVLSLAAAAQGPTGSYVRPTPAEEAAFWASGGRSHAGRTIHIHVPPTPFRKPPLPLRGFLVFVHRNVRFAMAEGDPALESWRRRRATAGTACVKGVVRRARVDGADAAIVEVRSIRLVRGAGH